MVSYTILASIARDGGHLRAVPENQTCINLHVLLKNSIATNWTNYSQIPNVKIALINRPHLS